MDTTAITSQQAGAVTLETDICIAGDGPAGMIMGLFLAKQGMNVIVLERNPDFHQPQQQNETSFTQLMYELQLLDSVDRHIKPAMQELYVFLEEEKVQQLLMKPLYKHNGHMNRMVLLALYRQAESFSNLKLLKSASVKGILFDEDVLAGVYAETDEQTYFIHSKITVGTDGEPHQQIEKAALADKSLLWMTESMGSVSEAM
ncbi:FAD-dependent monooxygenase [Domibacillus sp. DTU_2020_1001157_1_SI_ALB_TIR_016]|uniref:FAD-dependent monooxygenase n=1 Tax=Domibacillus sp. DTU_2020_1001157_1_SI_ALB_TIR_016 TaxID=3077789 RepID=UPI0028E34306|nr:FAD-dependent monooxygenase [Domibacillus sp. DTU_2020_1001157_1_SI_ALB_TIR_016]WNS80185.1 FAD-dependent monooxygenase [Domibacillus sp. DTU_2020_1001157_1_SI_ALB_TIR_016]